MLRSVRSLTGYKIRAEDGDIGKVHDFLFDSRTWHVRYLVVDTHMWWPGKKVLIIPSAIGKADWEVHELPVKLTKKQIKEGPDVDTDQPVSRQNEMELYRHYGWTPYWIGGDLGLATPAIPMQPENMPEQSPEQPQTERGDPDMRSCRNIKGYHIHAADGLIGHADDFIISDDDWMLRYMVVDTKNWLSGRSVLIVPQWIEKISWSEAQIYVDMSRQAVRESPPFDPTEPVNREYEIRMYDYYGRPEYWSQPNL